MKKYKILMALMGLEIGGAETHVVELSKELKKQGYDIIVASNGGVFCRKRSWQRQGFAITMCR